MTVGYGIAEQSEGALNTKSKKDEGTQVTLYLPRTNTPLQSERPTRPLAAYRTTTDKVVLLLEDDTGVRNFITRLLEIHGYEVLQAPTAAAAREIVTRGATFDLLLSDIMLPGGVLGPDFAKELLDQHPDVPVIFMSGRPSEIEKAAAGEFDEAAVLKKPFSKDVLLNAISAALNSESTLRTASR